MKDDYYVIARLHRDDLRPEFTQEQIDSLTDYDMQIIANKMGDAYSDNGYWIDLKIIAEQILEDKKGDKK